MYAMLNHVVKDVYLNYFRSNFLNLTNFRNIFVGNCLKYNGTYENRVL